MVFTVRADSRRVDYNWDARGRWSVKILIFNLGDDGLVVFRSWICMPNSISSFGLDGH